MDRNLRKIRYQRDSLMFRVLALVAESAPHSCAIHIFHQLTDSIPRLAHAHVYGALRKLEAEQEIYVSEMRKIVGPLGISPPVKIYELTEKGRVSLEKHSARLTAANDNRTFGL